MSKKSKSSILIPVIGILAVVAGIIPFMVLQGKCSVSVREELDGEIVGYILGARYLFSGKDYYPEFLGGVPKTALMPPSFLTLILFRIFSPLHAYIANCFVVMMTAFAGMYLWLGRLTKNRLISMAVGVIFAFLPYFTVYGISVAGIPLVFLAFYELVYGENKKGSLIMPFVLIAYYGIGSSLVLCGFAVIGVLVIWFVFLLISQKKKGIGKKELFAGGMGIAELAIVYVILNISLLTQVFNPVSSYVSHKSEYVLNEASFAPYFWEMFTEGAVAVPSLHVVILPVAVLSLALIGVYHLVSKKKAEKDEKKNISAAVILILSAVLIAALSGLRHCHAIVGFLNSRGGALKSFQFDRFYWLYPFIWYSVLGLVGVLLVKTFSKYHIGTILFVIILIPCGLIVLKESAFKENAMEFFRENSTALTWDAFFCEDEFGEIAEYIKNETGLSRDEYRVGSLGIEPSVAFYSGFYTIDGYSNNYDVEYKHRFRKVIEKELDKNSYNRAYFDDWGNRCYLYSSEYYGNPLLSKYEHPYFADLELNTDALKDLGCRYILAAGMIEGADEKGLRLCTVFDKAEYTYVIYLYEVL